jgi:cytochrome c556
MRYVGAPRGWRAALAVALLSCAVSSGAADGEIAICASDETRAAVRAEMRQLLEAVHGIHAALAERDFDVLAERAAAVGSGMRGQVEHGNGQGHPPGLPHEFVKLGLATHAAFDELATLAREGGRPRELLPALSGVTAHCVGCHARYRLTVADDCALGE